MRPRSTVTAIVMVLIHRGCAVLVPDPEIKVAVLQSIVNSPGLKAQRIKVDVNSGEMKLSGNVQSSAQKAAAESAARANDNVRYVDSNSLAVTSRREGQP